MVARRQDNVKLVLEGKGSNPFPRTKQLIRIINL